nr:hypothetical protein [Streptomyces sp. Termitarium-T10T-6]
MTGAHDAWAPWRSSVAPSSRGTVAEAEVAALDWIADAALRHEHLNVLVARLDETRRAPDRGVERPGGLHPADADPVIADVRTGPKSARNLLIVVPR